MNELIEYKITDNIVEDTCEIIDSAQKVAYKAVNSTLVIRNWLLGKRICEEELKGEKRAEYGNKLISLLADELTKKYGKGFSQRSLYNCICFYKSFPRILQTLSAKFTPAQPQQQQTTPIVNPADLTDDGTDDLPF